MSMEEPTIGEITQEILDAADKVDMSDSTEIISFAKNLRKTYNEKEIGIVVLVLATKVIQNEKEDLISNLSEESQLYI